MPNSKKLQMQRNRASSDRPTREEVEAALKDALSKQHLLGLEEGLEYAREHFFQLYDEYLAPIQQLHLQITSIINFIDGIVIAGRQVAETRQQLAEPVGDLAQAIHDADVLNQKTEREFGGSVLPTEIPLAYRSAGVNFMVGKTANADELRLLAGSYNKVKLDLINLREKFQHERHKDTAFSYELHAIAEGETAHERALWIINTMKSMRDTEEWTTIREEAYQDWLRTRRSPKGEEAIAARVRNMDRKVREAASKITVTNHFVTLPGDSKVSLEEGDTPK